MLATLTTQAVLMLGTGVSNTPHGTKLISLRYKLSIKIVIFGGAQVLRHTASCYDAVLTTLVNPGIKILLYPRQSTNKILPQY